MARARAAGKLGRSSFVGLLVVALLATLASAGDCPEEKVMAADAGSEDSLGFGVSLSGNLAIAGAPFADEGGLAGSGAAILFRHDGNAWLEEARLVAGDPDTDGSFGWRVSVSGDLALIGAAWTDEGSLQDSGAAYVFRRVGGAWTEEAKLVPSDLAAGDTLGTSVSLLGDVALVGAMRSDHLDRDTGAAYVFRHDGAGWVEEAKLVASDASLGARFGNAVSLSGDVALVGALGDDAEHGSAYVFRHDGRDWIEESKLRASDAADVYFFGENLSLSGDVAFVGARKWAYVFRFDGMAWTEEAILGGWIDPWIVAFTTSLAVSGETALIGTREEGPGGQTIGATHVYRHDGVSWAEEPVLEPSDGFRYDQFGTSVALSDTVILVGAIGVGSGGGGRGAGALYFYGCPSIDPCLIPEISPPGRDADRGAFLLAKAGSELNLSWQASPYDVDIHAGTLDALWELGEYDHEATSACRLDSSESLLTDALPSRAYLLVVGSSCAPSSPVGPAGQDSLGSARPSSTDLGLPTCP